MSFVLRIVTGLALFATAAVLLAGAMLPFVVGVVLVILGLRA